MFLLNFKYFCDSNEEIQDIKKSVEENTLENEKKRNEDFDIEKITKKNKENEVKQEVQISEIKQESFFIRMIHKILKLFIKK